MCIQSFNDIGQLVPKKTILKVFTIYGPGGHLGHVTRTNLNKISFLHPIEAQYEI